MTSSRSAANETEIAPPVPNPISHRLPSKPGTSLMRSRAASRSARHPFSEKCPSEFDSPRNATVRAIRRASVASRSTKPGNVRKEFAPPPAAAGNPGATTIPGRPLPGNCAGMAKCASSVPTGPWIAIRSTDAGLNAPSLDHVPYTVLPTPCPTPLLTRGDSPGYGLRRGCRGQRLRPFRWPPAPR